MQIYRLRVCSFSIIYLPQIGSVNAFRGTNYFLLKIRAKMQLFDSQPRDTIKVERKNLETSLSIFES